MSGTNAIIQKGIELSRLGDVRTAEAYFNKALEILPSSAAAYLHRSTARWNMGRQLEALTDIETALTLQPDEEVICAHAIVLLKAVQRQDKAIEIAYQYLAKHNNSKLILEYLSQLRGAPMAFDASINLASSFLNRDVPFLERELTTRTDVINFLIEKFNYKKYLEIGCHDNETFNNVACSYKVGVDPIQGGTIRLTSDAYFELSNDLFDIVFIDGLHHSEQVYKDIKNSLMRLKPNGSIVVHDCLPKEEIHQRRDPVDYVWNGDVWKAFALYRQDPNLDAAVCDFDNGVGIIRTRTNTEVVELGKPYHVLDWNDYMQNRSIWMRPKSSIEIKSWV